MKSEVSPRNYYISLYRRNESCPGTVKTGVVCIHVFCGGCQDAAVTCGVDETGPGCRREGTARRSRPPQKSLAGLGRWML